MRVLLNLRTALVKTQKIEVQTDSKRKWNVVNSDQKHRIEARFGNEGDEISHLSLSALIYSKLAVEKPATTGRY